jgi:transmembrane sensor
VRVVGGAHGVVELSAGESYDVAPVTPQHAAAASPSSADPNARPDPTSAPAATPDPTSAPADPSAAPDPTSTAREPKARGGQRTVANVPLDDWKDLARRGDYAQAYDAIGAPGIASATPRASVDELLALADVARLSGHPADAVGPLGRVISENPGDTRAPLAAFTLGRLELDTLGHPARAADAFARAIAIGLPAGLVEDAYARLVEARAKAGDHAGAEAAAQAYARAFPRGTRSTTMRRWLGDPDRSSSSPSP